MFLESRASTLVVCVCVAVNALFGTPERALGVPPGDREPESVRYTAPLRLSPGEAYSRPGFIRREGTAGAEVARSTSASIAGGDRCNDATSTVVAVPGSLTIQGDNTAATGPDLCPGNLGTVWWEAFEITQCADVILDFCGTNPVQSPSYIVLATQCSPDGSTCGGLVFADAADRTTCGDGNVWMIFEGLPAGVYYYPVLSDSPGPYQININTTTCVGACCTTTAGTCADGVAEANCVGADQTFLASAQCCETECRDPAGPEFDSSGVDLLSRVTFADFAAFNATPGDPHTGNEMWGYVSPSGREYALLGTTTGTGFVDVTDPRNPVIIAFINNGGVDTIWRDMAIFGQHAYVVTDGTGVGLQIIDLSDIDNGNVTFVKSTDLGVGLTNAHDVYVNPDSGFLYLCLSSINGEVGLPAVSLADPVNPVLVGTWTDATPQVRCHDVQVISYTSGPNAGREIAFCFAEDDGLVIADVTNKAAMFTVSKLAYPTRAYCHQGWTSADLRYILLDDELDELNGLVPRQTTYVADISNLSAPVLANAFALQNCNIDHNLMVRGDFVYEADYTAGLRVLDFSSPPNLSEFAFFDTHPGDNATGFDGAWGVFSDFPSGIVVLSDISRGLFIFDNPEPPPPPPPPPPPIPTVSAWGLCLLALLVITGGTLVVRRGAHRRTAA